MRTCRTLLGGCLALALALCGTLAYADESPQGFKGGYELTSVGHAYGHSVAAVEAHPELKANYHERTGSFGQATVGSKYMAKSAGYVLREVQPLAALSTRTVPAS